MSLLFLFKLLSINGSTIQSIKNKYNKLTILFNQICNYIALYMFHEEGSIRKNAFKTSFMFILQNTSYIS